MNPFGMLRYRDKDGNTCGIEASLIREIRPIHPAKEGEPVARIGLANTEERYSLDTVADLMALHDRIVYFREFRSDIR